MDKEIEKAIEKYKVDNNLELLARTCLARHYELKTKNTLDPKEVVL